MNLLSQQQIDYDDDDDDPDLSKNVNSVVHYENAFVNIINS